MAMGAWIKRAKPGEAVDLTEPPSEAFDREEVMTDEANRKLVKSSRVCR